MDVRVHSISKRFMTKWIIKEFSHHFPLGSTTGISGINGSGKSTLLRILSGYLSPSKGEVVFSFNGEKLQRNEVYTHVSYVAPYTDVVSEFTLREMYDFHRSFKSMSQVESYDHFLDILSLSVDASTTIQHFSSGMNQKLQLALGILSDTSLLILDEPTSYLDESNKSWFLDILGKHIGDRTTIIASNDPYDFTYCEEVMEVG